jgi:hypothetical protein
MLQSYCKQHNIELIVINGMNAGSGMLEHELGYLLDISTLVGFDVSLITRQIDFADDFMHPGKASNRVYANLVNNVFDLLSSKRIS